MRERARVLLVHAHPDDETLTTGGLIARCADAGATTHLVTCTDGRLGPVNPELGLSLSPTDLALHRRRELNDAAAILGITEAVWLGYHDSGMVSQSQLSATAFCATDVGSVTVRLVGIMRRVQPQVVVTYDACGGTAHPDHVHTHRVTMLAVAAADEPGFAPECGQPWRVASVFFPVFPRSAMETFIAAELAAGRPHPFGRPVQEINYVRDDAQVTHRVNIAAVWQRKADALAAFKTQVGPHNPQLVSGGLARRHYEHFRLAAGCTDVGILAEILERVV